MQGARRFPRSAKAVGWLAALMAAVLLAVAYEYIVRAAAPGQRLGNLLLAERFTTGRFTGQTSWQECTPIDTAALVPRVRCGEPLRVNTRHHRRVTRAHRELGSSPVAGSSLEALRGRALVDLRTADTASAPIERAVAALEEAHRRATEDAGVLNDLAVAYLALGERTQQLTPMLRALDAVERAAAADSANLSILFNRALILQRLYLIKSAERAWRRYLAVERDPRWRGEARAHAQWLARVPETLSWGFLLRSPPARVDPAVRVRITALVQRAPHAARDSAFVVLGRWGTAMENGDTVRAARLLSLVRAIGAAADSMGADHGVSLMVAAIDRAASVPARQAALAEGHGRLAAGYLLFYQAQYEAALTALDHAGRALCASDSAACRWASFYHAAAEINLGRFEAADRRLEAVLGHTTAAEPGLAGKATWARGVNQIRPGNYETASRYYRAALPFIERANEPENRGTIAYLLSESLYLAGQYHESRTEALRGLQLLAPYRASNFLNNHLTTVATFARADGLSHASLALMGEVLVVAHALGKADVIARAHRARARDFIALGQNDLARAELTTGASWAERIPGGFGGDRVRADVRLVLGRLLRRAEPDSALQVLAGVVETFRTVGIGMNLPQALYEASMAAEAGGDRGRARSFIHEAVGVLSRQQTSFGSVETRAAFHETTENVFDAMIRLELLENRPDSAFAYLERARATIQPAAPGAPRGTSDLGTWAVGAVGAALPGDGLLIDYALLEKQLVIWTVSPRGRSHHVVPLPRDSVAALVRRFGAGAAEAGEDFSRARALLFDLLLRPLHRELRGVRRLVIVPDRELYQIPFAALWDRRLGRYVVEDYEVNTVPSVAFYVLASSHTGRRRTGGPALVVGNPALQPEAAATLPPLPGALREAEQVAELYGDGRLLRGREARRQTLLALLPSHTVFHFAGHAVFNPEHPGASYLAVTPDSGGADGALRAREIREMRLSNLQVVILSACSTLSPRPSRAGAATGLAYSFLHAGVPATVSTVWDVRDDATTPLLVEFHRHLRRGMRASEALRLAQVQALRSGQRQESAPAAWAAFIYTGP